MYQKKFKNQKYKVGKTNQVELINQDCLHSDYKLKPYPETPVLPNGLLKIAEIIPKNISFPSFVLRWDKNQQTADIDIFLGQQNRKDLWEERGYKGHHPKKIKMKGVSGRILKLDIGTPKFQVFKGLIKVAIRHELWLQENFNLSDNLKTQ